MELTDFTNIFVEDGDFPDCAPLPEMGRCVRHHGFQGLFYRCLADAGRREAVRWRSDYQLIKHQNLVLSRELAELVAIAKAEGLVVVVLKGMAHLHGLYHDWGERFLSDVDLLVAPEEERSIGELMERCEYQNLGRGRWWANEFKSVWSKQVLDLEVNVELHTRLLPLGDPSWRVAFCSQLNAERLQAEDELVYLCIHLAYQHTFLSLNWLKDIDLLIRKHGMAGSGVPFDWGRVDQLASATNQQRAVIAALAASRLLFKTPLPAAVISRIDKIPMLRLLTPQFLWQPYAYPVRAQVLKHWLKGSMVHAFHYDWGWICDRVRGLRRHI